MEGESSKKYKDFVAEVKYLDDNKYGIKPKDCNNGERKPDPCGIELNIQKEREGINDLERQSPDKGSRTPQSSSYLKDNAADKTSQVKEVDDFEFIDEINQPRLSIRPAEIVGLRGSGRKITTTLDGIVSNMKRHRKLDMMEQD